MPTGVYERTPEMNAANSKRQKGVPHTSPAQIAADDAQRGVPNSPEHNAAIKKGLQESDAVKVYAEARKDVPLPLEHCAKISISHTGVPLSPGHIAAIKKGQEESEAVKAAADAQRGGNDLVTHHYIYDESDLSLNTVKMTRSDHMKLHRLLQKLGYVVPHINVKE